MRKLVSLAAFGGVMLALSAAETQFTWTGAGDGTSWNIGNNWNQKGAVPTANDRVIFSTGDDLEVGLPSGAITDIYRVHLQNSGTRKITFRGSGAVLRTYAGDENYLSHIVCSPMGELTLKVPVINGSSIPWKIYNQQGGVVNFKAVMTNVNAQAAGIVGGTNYFSAASGFYGPLGALQLGSDTRAAGGRSLVELSGDAFFQVYSLQVGGHSSSDSCSLDFVVNGAAARVNVSQGLDLGGGGTYTNPRHCMYLKSGTVTVGGAMTVAKSQKASYYQTGGTNTVGSLTFNSNVNSVGEFVVGGGRFESKGKVVTSTVNIPMRLENCTFAVGASSDISAPLTIAGAVTFELPSGVTLKLMNVSAEPGAKIRKSGDGTLQLYNNRTMSFEAVEALTVSELRVGYGESANFRLTGGTLNVQNLYLENRAGSRGACSVSNATLNVTSSLSVSGKNFLFSLADAAFKVAGDVNFDIDVAFAGKVTLEVPSGRTVTLSRGITFAPGCQLIKKGAGTLVLDHDCEWRGDLDIVEGRVRLVKDRLYANAPGDESVRRVDIRTAGNLYVDSYAAEITSPIDVFVEGSGYVYIGDRSLFAVRHFYVNGAKLPRGLGLSQANASYFRGSGEGLAVLAIPFVWTGAGNGYSYNDLDNWEDSVKPAAAVQSSPAGATSLRNTYLDLSRATRVELDSPDGDAIQIGGIIYNASAGERRLSIVKKHSTGERNAIRIDRAQYQPAMTVGRGCELVFDNVSVEQAGANDWVLAGGGTYRFQGGDDAFFAGAPFNHQVLPAAKVVLEKANNLASGNTPDFAFFGLGDNDRFSEFVLGDGLAFKGGDFHWGTGSGFSITRKVRQLEGASVSFDNFYLTATHATIRGEGTYYLEGGELECRTAFYLGSMYLDDAQNCQYPGLNFKMTGGTLVTPLLGCENNSNFLYLEGGEVDLGAGGMVKTVATRSNAAWRVFTANAEPCVQWGGATVRATAAFSIGLDIALTGIGGDAKLDTAGNNVTITSAISGKGRLVKSGSGTLTLNGSLAETSLRVSGGTLAFGSSVSQSTPLKALVAQSASGLSVASGKTVKTKTLVIGGVSKAAGSYAYGSGTVQVVGDDDWLAAAPYVSAYTANCTSARTISTLQYSCAVANAGTLTISGSGSLAFNANAEIFVREGDTVIVKVPVTLAGDLRVTGGGQVIFDGNATVKLKSGVSAAKFLVTEGSTAIVRTVVNNRNAGIAFYALTESPSLTCSCLRLEKGCAIVTSQTVSPTAGVGISFGGTLEIAGGTFRFTGDSVAIGGANDRKETLRLCGGALELKGQLALTEPALAVRLVLDGGKIDLYGGAGQFLPAMAVELNGDVTIAVSQSAGQVVSLKCDFVGSGTLTKTGVGQLDLYGNLAAVRKLSVNDGGLNLSAVAMASMSESAAIDVVSTSTLRLDYDGVLPVARIYLDHRELKGGIYAEGVSPQKRMLPIVGDGVISASRGALPGNGVMMY